MALVVASALMAGCSDDEPDASGATTPAAATTTPPSTDAASSADPVLVAIATAVNAVPGGQAIAYERADADTHLEVEVVADDRSHEVYVDLAGTTVTRQEPGEVLDAEDRAEFQGVEVPLETAITTAAATVPGAIVDEAGLEDAAVWDIEFRSGSGLQRVLVDARTGAVR